MKAWTWINEHFLIGTPVSIKIYLLHREAYKVINGSYTFIEEIQNSASLLQDKLFLVGCEKKGEVLVQEGGTTNGEMGA